jgi:hypothetical protein
MAPGNGGQLLLAAASRGQQSWCVYEWIGQNAVRHIGRLDFPYYAFCIQERTRRLVKNYADKEDGTSVLAL